MITIHREDLSAEDIENQKIVKILSHKSAVFWCYIEIDSAMDDIFIHIEARPPDSDVILEEGIFKPKDIPMVMYVLYRDHEVTRALAEFQNQLGAIYRKVEEKLLLAVLNR